MDTQTLLIIFVILIILGFCILVIKFILYPMFLKPKLHTTEAVKLIKSKNCLLIDCSPATKIEKEGFNKSNRLSFDYLFSVKSQYKLIGRSIDNNQYKLFWVEIQSWSTPFIKRQLNFTEENNSEMLTKLLERYRSKNTLVTDKCPACESTVTLKDIKCSNCGLNFS